MLGVSHVLLGAAVGKSIASPPVALLAGIASHLIVDKIPHFWPKTKKAQNRQIWTDVLGVIILFAAFLFWPFSNKINIFWGAFGGGLVDFVFVLVPMAFPKFMNNPVRVWHEERQFHHSNLVYLLTDILLSIISLVLIFI